MHAYYLTGRRQKAQRTLAAGSCVSRGFLRPVTLKYWLRASRLIPRDLAQIDFPRHFQNISGSIVQSVFRVLAGGNGADAFAGNVVPVKSPICTSPQAVAGGAWREGKWSPFRTLRAIRVLGSPLLVRRHQYRCDCHSSRVTLILASTPWGLVGIPAERRSAGAQRSPCLWPRRFSGNWRSTLRTSESCLPRNRPMDWPVAIWNRLLTKVGNGYCRIFHKSISRPVQGRYRCWTCLREFELRW